MAATLLALCTASGFALADTASDLEDVAARIQYAFYTEDERAIGQGLNALAQLDTGELRPGLAEYYSAYGNWKLAQVRAASTTSARGSVGKAAQECVRYAKAARTRDARMSEAFALEAICSAFGSNTFSGSCADERSLKTALELDPRNPRIRLIAVLCAEQGKRSPAERLQPLRELVDHFEALPVARPGAPDWGQAEALVMLGQGCLEAGDPLAARDALEQALIIAPDYRLARQLLETTAGRPS